jgi:hypothetical protein
MKDFFKKLFGSAQRQFFSRSPRVAFLRGDGVHFECSGKSFPVRDLSDSGLGIERVDREFTMGAVLDGKLTILSKEIAVRVEVIRVTEDVLGCKFLDDARPVRAALVDLFQEEIQASGMSEVSSKSLAKEEGGNPRWFYAPGNFELYLLENEGQVSRFELNLDGCIYSAKKGSRLRVGNVPEELRGNPSHAKSSLIQWRDNLEEAERLKAERVIRNIKPLPKELGEQIIQLLRS